MKIFLDTVGCRLNQSEIETMARQFRAAGHEIVASPELADLAVVNTCTVTNEAASDSRGKIRQIARAGAAKIVATGCWVTLQPRDAEALPNVLRVIPNQQKADLVSTALDRPPSSFIIHPSSFSSLRTRAFVKVQDGCDNHCTFCVTTIARGAGKSCPLAEVVQDIQLAVSSGAKEVVLTGVHLGSWGYDFGYRLEDLIKAILRETDTPRLRLSSLEPWDLNAAFFSLWSDPRFMPHLHLPLQSGCDATLKRMARKTTGASFRELIQSARDAIPDVAITTDIIAGFPGETDEEFAQSLAFVNEMNFAGGHVFTYSPRPLTAAAKMKGQIPPEVRKRRNRILRDSLNESANAYRGKFIGRKVSVLWETAEEIGNGLYQLEGWSENYLRVRAVSPTPKRNEIETVELAK